MHKQIPSVAFILLLICSGFQINTNNDGGLDLSDEQLQQLMKNRPTMPGENNGDAALLQLETAYQEDSSQIDNVYNLAYMYTARCIGDSTYICCPKALQYLNRSLVLSKNHRWGNAFYNRMLCYQHLGNYEAAIKDIDTYTELHKNDEKPLVNFYYQKAVLLQQSGKMKEACAELKNAAKLDTTGLGDLGLNCP